MALGTWFMNMAIAPSYIVCKIGLEAKRYGIKNSIVNITNFVAHYTQLLY
jgi:hypothetical protein